MSERFRKKTEDFICEHCGEPVVGSGFTNHCPKCLYSKHVDIFPGDRKNACGGLMQPTTIMLKRGTYTLVHRCLACGQEKNNRTSPDDNLDVLLPPHH